MKLAKNIKKDFKAKTFLYNILSNAYVIQVFEDFLRSPLNFCLKFYHAPLSCCPKPFRSKTKQNEHSRILL